MVAIPVALDGNARVDVSEVDAVAADAVLDGGLRQAGRSERAQQARLEAALRHPAVARADHLRKHADASAPAQLPQLPAQAGEADQPSPQGVVQCLLQNVGIDAPGQIDERASGRRHRDRIDDRYIRARQRERSVDDVPARALALPRHDELDRAGREAGQLPQSGSRSM